MQTYVLSIEKAFKASENPETAIGQKAYMKYKFEFFGLKSPVRKSIQQPFFLKSNLPEKKELSQIVSSLWKSPQRELQYCAQELAHNYSKEQEKKDIELFEYMTTHKSWWDTVDFIASKLVGSYFINYPESKQHYVDKWLASGNIWLQRTALLFQLKYKRELDTALLKYIINRLSGSDEFFINKAIGWMLREYSKTNPEWVISFKSKNKLDKLSHREALKWLNRKNQ